MKMKFFVLLLLVLLGSIGAAKQKTQKVKVVYVEKAPPVVKQLSQYDLCKQECRIQRNAQSNKERVEQLKQELQEAELLLEEHNKHVDAPEIPKERLEALENVQVERVPTGRKPSRYDHLKMAANKIVETGSELKNAVTGGGEN